MSRPGNARAILAFFCAVLLSAAVSLQSASQAPAAPGPAPKTPAPAPDRFTLDQVKPDAVLNVIGASGVAASGTTVWVMRGQSGTVSKVDLASNTVALSVAVGPGPCSAQTGLGSLWISLCGEASVARIDADKGSLTSVVPRAPNGDRRMTASAVGSLWLVADAHGTLLRIDPASRKPVAEVYLPKGTSLLAEGPDAALWATGGEDNTVTRVDPHTNLIVESIKVGKQPSAIAVGEDAVWILNRGDHSVSRIDPKSNRVTSTIEVGAPAGEGYLAAGERSVWLSGPGAPLTRIDAKTNTVVQQITGDAGGPIAVAGKSLWVVMRPGQVWRIDPRFIEALR